MIYNIFTTTNTNLNLMEQALSKKTQSSYSRGNLLIKIQSSWSLEELSKYITFLSKNRDEMICEGWNSYKALARFIESKNYRQCRIYHQLLLQKYGSAEKVVEKLLQSKPELHQQIQKQLSSCSPRQDWNKKQKENLLIIEPPKTIDYPTKYPQSQYFGSCEKFSQPSSEKKIQSDAPTGCNFANEDPLPPQNYKFSLQMMECQNFFLRWMTSMSMVMLN